MPFLGWIQDRVNQASWALEPSPVNQSSSAASALCCLFLFGLLCAPSLAPAGVQDSHRCCQNQSRRVAARHRWLMMRPRRTSDRISSGTQPALCCHLGIQHRCHAGVASELPSEEGMVRSVSSELSRYAAKYPIAAIAAALNWEFAARFHCHLVHALAASASCARAHSPCVAFNSCDPSRNGSAATM